MMPKQVPNVVASPNQDYNGVGKVRLTGQVRPPCVSRTVAFVRGFPGLVFPYYISRTTLASTIYLY